MDVLITVCMVCGKKIGEKPDTRGPDDPTRALGNISHGYCLECFRAEEAKLDALECDADHLRGAAR